MSNRRQPPIFTGDPFASTRVGPEPIGYTNFIRPPPQAGGGTWSVDGTSGIAVPNNATEWANFIAANGLTSPVPDSLWLLQEASGNLADTIGAIGAVNLTGDAGNLYQQTVTGWSRKGVACPTDGTTHIGVNIAAPLPVLNAAGAGQTVFAFVNMPSTPGANRDVYQGGGAAIRMRLNTTPRLVAVDGANTATGASNPLGTRPVGMSYFTPDGIAGSCVGYSDQDKMTPTFVLTGAVRGLRLGGSSSGLMAPPATWLYAWAYYNANANLSSAQLKALLIAMGFAIPWS